ncbi:hypothetical protein U8L64_13210 [Pseudomonas sp. FIP_A4]|nr:hypothetical protein [Stutzerimonas stutzeri]MCQ4267825.1 hypothetical protein [Stutzerimonas degradans]
MDDYKHKQETNKNFANYLRYIGEPAVPRRAVVVRLAAQRVAPKLPTG